LGVCRSSSLLVMFLAVPSDSAPLLFSLFSFYQYSVVHLDLHSFPTRRSSDLVRYADDWALGFSGPKAEAEEIKREIRDFLRDTQDRKSTRLNSSHGSISYAVFCLKKKTRRLQPSTHHT